MPLPTLTRTENCLEPLDFTRLSQLTFEQPDFDKFPCLGLAYAAIRTGGTMPAALNAANEVAVQAFLDGQIRLSEVAMINRRVMDAHISKPVTDLETVLESDRWARAAAAEHLTATAIGAGLQISV